MTVEEYTRPIYITASGTAISNDTRLVTITVTPRSGDASVYLHDGPGGQIVWHIEADNAAGSHTVTFSPGLRFRKGIYVEIAKDMPNDTIGDSLAVVEPYTNQ